MNLQSRLWPKKKHPKHCKLVPTCLFMTSFASVTEVKFIFSGIAAIINPARNNKERTKCVVSVGESEKLPWFQSRKASMSWWIWSFGWNSGSRNKRDMNWCCNYRLIVDSTRRKVKCIRLWDRKVFDESRDREMKGNTPVEPGHDFFSRARVLLFSLSLLRPI